MKKAIVFGAGQIGRGFIGEICFDSGYFIVFVDVDKNLVNLLNKEKFYPIWILGEKREEKIIKNFKAVHINGKKEIFQNFIDAEIVFTSVGAKNLPSLSKIFAESIKERFKKNQDFLNIIICENLLDSSKKLRELILTAGEFSYEEMDYINNKIGFVETVISRMTSPLTEEEKKINPLIVKVEPYKILPIDKNAFKGKIPKIDSFYPVLNLKKYEELKIFGHNLSHVTLAYYGYIKNYQYIWECIEDGKIYKLLRKVQKEVKEALIKKYNFDKDEIEEYFKDLNKRFKNKLLQDTVFRVGREPLRKIGKDERIVGAINLCLRNCIFPKNICFVLSCALCYNYKLDEEAVKLSEILEKNGIFFVLNEICKIKEEKIIENVIRNYERINNERKRSNP